MASASSQTPEHAQPCWHCGYDLRVTPHGQPCPECGKVDTMPPSGLRAEDGFLIVRPGATMPRRCVKTNRTEDIEPVTKMFYRSPAWLDLTGCLFPPLFLLKRVLREHDFEMTYWLSIRIRRRSQIIRLFSIAAVLNGGLLLAFDFADWAQPVGGTLVVFGFMAFIFAMRNLEAVAFDGNDYWIKGCGRAFLEQVNQDNRDAAAARLAESTRQEKADKAL